MMLRFENAFIMRKSVQDIMGTNVPLKLFNDSGCLFHALTTIHPATEKQLLIDLSILRQSYEHRDIAEILRIPGRNNPADALAKSDSSPALTNLLNNNTMIVNPNG